MTDSNDYRLYLEKSFDDINEKFKGLTSHIHAQFEDVHETLNEIKEQTTKHNNRMTKIEMDIIKHPVECSNGKDIDIIKNVISNNIAVENLKKEGKSDWFKTAMLVVAILAFMSAALFSFKNWQLSKANYSNTFMTNKKLDQMDNSGLTRAIHEYKNENNILKLDTVNREFDEVEGVDPYSNLDIK